MMLSAERIHLGVPLKLDLLRVVQNAGERMGLLRLIIETGGSQTSCSVAPQPRNPGGWSTLESLVLYCRA